MTNLVSVPSPNGSDDDVNLSCERFYSQLPPARPIWSKTHRSGIDPLLFKIVDAVQYTSHVSLGDLFSKRRPAYMCDARHVCYYLAKEMTSLSTHDLACFFHVGDHSTILWGIHKIETRISQPFEHKIRSLLTDSRQRLALLVSTNAHKNALAATALIESLLSEARAAADAIARFSTGEAKSHLIETIRLASEALYKAGENEASQSQDQTNLPYAV